MTTSERWRDAIDRACAEPNPAKANEQITQLHYGLSVALAGAMGREGGPNFHTWAVWGSRKAGVTIRQEDLKSAVRNATVTAGIVGSVVGATVGILARHWLPALPGIVAGAIGSGVGAFAGAWTGKLIAIWSRGEAARLVLEGNCTVLKDIGVQSARFLELLEQGASDEGRSSFFTGLRLGATESGGQDRLASAFRYYLAALDSTDLSQKREAMIAGNCQIVHHEHIRLEPFIRGSMPFIVQRCATERMMTYEIGARQLSVGRDVPGFPSTAASNWSNLNERMCYIYALFRKFHNEPEVFSPPSLTPAA